MDMDESAAISRIRHRDPAGLDYLVKKYQLEAARTAYLITYDPALAEDIVQEAFVRAYEHIAQLRIDQAFRSWFFRSVINAAIRAATRSKRQVSLHQTYGAATSPLSAHLASAQPSPEVCAEQAETQAAINAALMKLSPEQRAVIIQRYYLDLSEREMAEVLGCPAGTIKGRLHVARKRLQTLLGPLRYQASF